MRHPGSCEKRGYMGKYTLTLITCRKVNRLHVGSIPTLPTSSSWPELEGVTEQRMVW